MLEVLLQRRSLVDFDNIESNYKNMDNEQNHTHSFVRTVGNYYTVFTIESFIDEVAHEIEVDPLDLRLLVSALGEMLAQISWKTARSQGSPKLR